MIQTIDEEIAALVAFLSHPCGFEVSVFSMLEIRPIDEGSPPSDWEVDWKEHDGTTEIEYFKAFSSLQEAAQFFVEKRRYMCLGADFEAEMIKEETIDD